MLQVYPFRFNSVFLIGVVFVRILDRSIVIRFVDNVSLLSKMIGLPLLDLVLDIELASNSAQSCASCNNCAHANYDFNRGGNARSLFLFGDLAIHFFLDGFYFHISDFVHFNNLLLKIFIGFSPHNTNCFFREFTRNYNTLCTEIYYNR